MNEEVEFLTEDIDTESLLGHLYLTSNLHNIPIDYPPHFFQAAKLMLDKCTVSLSLSSLSLSLSLSLSFSLCRELRMSIHTCLHSAFPSFSSSSTAPTSPSWL